MAPSSEYHKRSHSQSEVLRFSCALKNAGSVYYRRYTKWKTTFLKMTQEVFVRGHQRRPSCYYYYSTDLHTCTFSALAAAIRSLLLPTAKARICNLCWQLGKPRDVPVLMFLPDFRHCSTDH